MSDIEPDDTLKARVTDSETWKRFLYMLLFGVAFQVSEALVFAVIVVQFLFKLLGGEPNARLAAFGRDLGIYFDQLVAFLTFDTEDMPFPLAPWPDGTDMGGTDMDGADMDGAGTDDSGLDDTAKSVST
jgi:hypothetical protein